PTGPCNARMPRTANCRSCAGVPRYSCGRPEARDRPRSAAGYGVFSARSMKRGGRCATAEAAGSARWAHHRPGRGGPGPARREVDHHLAWLLVVVPDVVHQAGPALDHPRIVASRPGLVRRQPDPGNEVTAGVQPGVEFTSPKGRPRQGREERVLVIW